MTHRLESSDPAKREFTLDCSVPSCRRLPLSDLLSNKRYFQHLQHQHVEQLLEIATDAVRLLHRHSVSFPNPLAALSVVLPAGHPTPSMSPPQPLLECLSRQERLVPFLEYNLSARHLPHRERLPRRRARREELDLRPLSELAAATSLLFRLRDAPAPCFVDAPGQMALRGFLACDFSNTAYACLMVSKVANPSPQLALSLACALTSAADRESCRLILHAVLRGSEAAPPHIVDPEGILRFFYTERRRLRPSRQQVATTLQPSDTQERSTPDPWPDTELDGEVLAKLLVYSAAIEGWSGGVDKAERWRDAVIMFDVYLSGDGWRSSICSFAWSERTTRARELLRLARIRDEGGVKQVQ